MEKVNKQDYEIFEHLGDYYSIAKKGSYCSETTDNDKIVWGGDSAFNDCYDLDLVQSIYDNWDGTLDEWGKITVN